MWQPLISPTQLHEGARIRQIVHEGNFQHEAVYKVSSIGDHFFATEMIERNGIIIPFENQYVTPCAIISVPYLGYEIWVD